MEIKILNSILFKELMPWVFNGTNLKPINEKLKKIGSKEATTEAELIQQLQILVADYPELTKWLTKQLPKATGTIKNHCFAIDFTEFTNATTKFYQKIISLETLRVYNAFNTKIQHYKHKTDIYYHATIALNNVKASAIETVRKIKEMGVEATPTVQIDLSHFVLQLLRQHLIILFFDIQELCKANLESTTSIEDFYLLDLELPKSYKNELKPLENKAIAESKSMKQINSKLFNFGFKGDKEGLVSIVQQLCIKFDLLEEKTTSQSILIEALTTKDLKQFKTPIHLGCATNEFQEIQERLKQYLGKFNPSNIEKSKLFISKEGNLVDANLLYVTKNKTKLSKDKIDQIKDIFQNINN